MKNVVDLIYRYRISIGIALVAPGLVAIALAHRSCLYVALPHLWRKDA